MNLDDYEDVQTRLDRWYSDHPNARVSTRLEHSAFDDSGTLLSVVVSAAVYRDADDAAPAGTGLAQEQRAERGVNLAFALENAETSAIGRAIVNAGQPPAGGNRPSRTEMTKVADVDAAVAAVADAMPGSRVTGTIEGKHRPSNPDAAATEKQIRFVVKLLDEIGATDTTAKRAYVESILGKAVPAEKLTKQQAMRLIDALKEDADKQAEAGKEANRADPWGGDPA